jgi:hypothetical protein
MVQCSAGSPRFSPIYCSRRPECPAAKSILFTPSAVMGWFKRKRPRRPETLVTPLLKFLGEQDGPPEKELKGQLCELFRRRDHVHRAYLARVVYSNPEELHVALCIRMSLSDDAEMRQAIGSAFSRMFGTHEHLDIIFLRPGQEEDVQKVCQPFYMTP